MDSSDYARKYMKYKLKYKNLQKSIVQAGGLEIEVLDDEPVASQAAAPLQPVVLSQAAEPLQHVSQEMVLSQAAKPSFSTKKSDIITITYTYGEYNGFHLNGIPYGKGVLKYTNRDEYWGEFVNGYPHGTGALNYADGGKYTGNFINGYRHGTGTMIYTDGIEYTGKFVNGYQHGTGTMKYKSNDETTGYFVNGSINGEGTYTYANGDKYIGNYMDGVRDGIGKYVYSDGIIYEGHFTNGNVNILRPIPTIISKPYSITLFINAHGCELRNIELPFSYSNIELKYLNSTTLEHVHSSKSDRDIAYASVLFNTKTHTDAVEQYRIKKGKLNVSKHERKHNRMFGFGINVTREKPNDYDIFDGIIIIQNTLGLPNNVNLFNFTEPSKINDSIDDTITEFSRMLVKGLNVGKIGMVGRPNTIVLSYLLSIINNWFLDIFQKKRIPEEEKIPEEKIPGEKLNLTIIDNSCRVYC